MTNFPYHRIWWRFNRYEIVEECIQPAEGAAMSSYSPWDAYNESAGTVTLDRPYVRFLSMVEELNYEVGKDGKVELTPAAKARLLDWCQEFGLLGVLPHEAMFASLAPRWRQSVKTSDPLLSPDVRTFLRAGGNWEDLGTQYGEGGGNSIGVEEMTYLETLTDKEYTGKSPSPHVILQDLSSGLITSEPLSKRWARFFMNVPLGEEETFNYPLPLSDAFVGAYKEPLSEFLRSAVALKTAIDVVLNSRREVIYPFIDPFIPLLTPISPFPNLREDGSTGVDWNCSSLLSAFAMMAATDLTSGGKLERCSVCRRLFTSTSDRALYCSIRCRQTAQKRAYRKRHSKEG